MSRSNYDKPFYVDVGTSIAAIRCASNSDVILEYDYRRCPQVIQFAKDACDRMNREAEIGRPLRNCDVGTAEEQCARFQRFCDKYTICHKCPLWRGGGPVYRCYSFWSNLLYKKGETK